MSRADAMEDYEGETPWELYEQTRKLALKGKRGQKAMRELRDHLRALAEREGPKLAYDMLADKSLGAGCAVGEYIIMKRCAAGEDRAAVVEDLHGRAEDDPEETAWMGSRAGLTYTLAYELEYANDRFEGTPEDRWRRLMAWLDDQIEEGAPA